MLAELRRFINDESGIIEKIVGIALVVIIAGGILLAILTQVQGVGDTVNQWLADNIPGFGG